MIDMLLHANVHLGHLVASLGPWSYVILFAIIFAETGVVVLPFLPGDSLLFAVGALAALPAAQLDIGIVTALLVVAALSGDALNYTLGLVVGPRVSRWINPQHLLRTQQFYDRHGGKTILLARFIPIIRTIAPFVAGLAKMRYRHFAIYNVVGGVAWILSMTFSGYWFGNLPSIQRNFHVVILVIVAISLLPVVFEFVRARKSALL